MRVIAGTLRGKSLASFQGQDVRPTSDKVRGAIFSALYSRLGDFSGTHVLDMFAGSAALTIEALSRGAEKAVLFDASSSGYKLASDNLKACNLADSTRVYRGDVFKLLPKTAIDQPFDLVFIDPPYGKGLAEIALKLLVETDALADDAWVVVETAREETITETCGRLNLSHQRHYGSSTIHFYCNEPTDEAGE